MDPNTAGVSHDKPKCLPHSAHQNSRSIIKFIKTGIGQLNIYGTRARNAHYPAR